MDGRYGHSSLGLARGRLAGLSQLAGLARRCLHCATLDGIYLVWLVVPDLLAWSPLIIKLLAIAYGEIQTVVV